MLGEGLTQRCPSGIEPLVAGPAAADDGQSRADLVFLIDNRASSPMVMPCRIGIGKYPVKPSAARSELDPRSAAVDGIGPIEDDDVDIRLASLLHHVSHQC